MKNLSLLILISLIGCSTAFAQKTFKLNKSSGTLLLENMNAVEIEAYGGNQIEITTEIQEEEVDTRAIGLRPVSGALMDNSGIGLHVKELANGVTQLTRVNAYLGKRIFIKLPKKVNLSIRNRGVQYDEDELGIVIKNVYTEIDAVMQYGDIKLENISGPSNINNIYGNIEATLNDAVKGPFSLVSVYGFIDMSIPTHAKADLNMSTNFGNILVSEQLNMNIETPVAPPIPEAKVPPTFLNENFKDSILMNFKENGIHLDSLSSLHVDLNNISEVVTTALRNMPPISFGNRGDNKTMGKMNGGGTPIILKSNYGKIYLRELK